MFRIRSSLMVLFCCCFLVPCLLIVLCSSPLLGTITQGLMQTTQQDLGGAYGATSYNSLPSANAVATTATPTAQPKMYGGSGPGGSCLGTSGAGDKMITMDFGWNTSVLNTAWTDFASYRLCNDHYTWETTTQMTVEQVLQQLGWPSASNPPDLLQAQYDNQIVTLKPLSTFDPVTQQAQETQQQTIQNQQNQSSGPCDWVPDLVIAHPHINICEPLRLLINAGSAAIRGIYQSASKQLDFLWQTPLQPFQDDTSGGLLLVWSTSWSIVLLCITSVLAYGGLRSMLGSAVNWLAYANLTELLPRVLFGLLAAYFSKAFFLMLLQANNALAGIFNHSSLDTIINGKTSGIVDESLQIIYGLMGFLLMIEEAARMAILYILFAFAPILFFFASLRETQRWAKTAAVAAILFAFLQAVQAATLDVGGRVLGTVLHNTDGQLSFLNVLVSLAILYITLTLFFALARLALGVGGGLLGTGVMGAYLFGRRSAAAGGALAGAYRQARRKLFPLPDAAKKTASNTNRRPGNNPGGRRIGNPAGPAGGSSGQRRQQIISGKRPSVSQQAASGGPGGQVGTIAGARPVGGNGKKTGGARPVAPGGSGGKAPAATPKSPGGKKPGNARPLVPSGSTPNKAGSSAGPGKPPVAGPAQTPTNQAQWQKTPPQPSRQMTEDELIEWLNEQDSH